MKDLFYDNSLQYNLPGSTMTILQRKHGITHIAIFNNATYVWISSYMSTSIVKSL
jgi:hypothetical protein